ncbi:MAG: YybH family protein [Stellaceae bacterium]
MPEQSWDAAMARLLAVQHDFLNGDASGLQQLYSHRQDVTVMGGFGGFERGWAEVGPRLDWAASHFHGGDYSQQDISATVGSDHACLVSIERWARQTAPGGRPIPVMALRVTQTFRLEDGEWRLVHRHADELVEKHEPG